MFSFKLLICDLGANVHFGGMLNILCPHTAGHASPVSFAQSFLIKWVCASLNEHRQQAKQTPTFMLSWSVSTDTNYSSRSPSVWILTLLCSITKSSLHLPRIIFISGSRFQSWAENKGCDFRSTHIWISVVHQSYPRLLDGTLTVQDFFLFRISNAKLHLVPRMSFHSFDVFSVSTQCRKKSK